MGGKEQLLKAAGNYQDMAWRSCCSQEETWILLRENVVLPRNHVQGEIALNAFMGLGVKEEGRLSCRGNLTVTVYWRAGNPDEDFIGAAAEEESLLRRSFFLEPPDGGRPALGKTSSSFGSSRFPGFLWLGRNEEPGGDDWQKTQVVLAWQVRSRLGIQPEQAELVCLHGVRTGLRTVLLEALIRVPVLGDAVFCPSEGCWLGQEEIGLALEDDAVAEVLGVGFWDLATESGYDRDLRGLKLHWLSRLTIFYLRAPSGGGRIGMVSYHYDEATILSALPAEEKDTGICLQTYLPVRRDVEVRVMRPDQLLCRFGLYINQISRTDGHQPGN